MISPTGSLLQPSGQLGQSVFGPVVPPASPKKVAWLAAHHWSHADDLKRCMRGESSEDEGGESPRKRSKHGKRKKQRDKKKDKKDKEDSPKSVIPAATPQLSPRLANCRTLPGCYRSAGLPEATCNGAPLMPGLNLSPRRGGKQPVASPSRAGLVTTGRYPPQFRLDSGWP